LKNQKIEITKYLAEQEGLAIDDPHLKKLQSVFWQNPRNKETGGMRLTPQGFETLSKYFKSHFVRFEETREGFKYTNQLVLRLDNYIDCPWHINHKGVWVFSDKMAVQLVLFSGNIEKFTTAKARALDKTQD
jgi:hypothetical protein